MICLTQKPFLWNRQSRIDRIDLSDSRLIAMIFMSHLEFPQGWLTILNEHGGQFVPHQQFRSRQLPKWCDHDASCIRVRDGARI